MYGCIQVLLKATRSTRAVTVLTMDLVKVRLSLLNISKKSLLLDLDAPMASRVTVAIDICGS